MKIKVFFLLIAISGTASLDAQTPSGSALLILAKEDNALLVVDPGSLKVTGKFPVGPQSARSDRLTRRNDCVHLELRRRPMQHTHRRGQQEGHRHSRRQRQGIESAEVYTGWQAGIHLEPSSARRHCS